MNITSSLAMLTILETLNPEWKIPKEQDRMSKYCMFFMGLYFDVMKYFLRWWIFHDVLFCDPTNRSWDEFMLDILSYAKNLIWGYLPLISIDSTELFSFYKKEPNESLKNLWWRSFNESCIYFWINIFHFSLHCFKAGKIISKNSRKLSFL